jgi:multicomponent Na+:H+ antiporter subunit G
MRDLIAAALIGLGGLFALVAAIGVVRMPDLFTRMQAATKAGTLGAGFILFGLAIHFFELGIATRAVLVTAFVFLTAPVAAHMIARAAYHVGTPLWEKTVIDELRERHDPETHTVASGLEEPEGPPAKRMDPEQRPPEGG